MIDHEEELGVADGTVTESDRAEALDKLKSIMGADSGPTAVRAAEVILKEGKMDGRPLKIHLNEEELKDIGGAFIECEAVFRAASEGRDLATPEGIGCPESLLPL